ncbi:MAG: ATP-binding protein [Longimicrobiales bacterium]
MQTTSIPVAASSEPAAAVFQAAVTLALAAVCVFLYRRYRKRYFAAWSAAWLLYSLRLAVILVFLLTEQRIWLYWHQVVTGWTGLAILWAALVFSQPAAPRRRYAWLFVFPVIWSYIAIYQMNDFLLAALPAVLFLSGATVWTAWVFLRHHRQVGSGAALILAVTLLLWGFHHLDYPFLRAQGVWNPWGYYIDILFELAMGAGILLLVGEDLDRGLHTLSVLSGHLQPGGGSTFLPEWLGRALTLPAVRGSALWVRSSGDGSGVIVAAAGACSTWTGQVPSEQTATAVVGAMRTREPVIARDDGTAESFGYVAALPVLRRESIREVLLVVGDARDPFAALDVGYLVALGQQLGAALENAELYRGLEDRTVELERIAARMVHQHEAERRRLSRELHDETAQVFAAVNMQLGMLRETADHVHGEKLDRVLALMDEGIRGIRSVTDRLRPPLLDDLGLLPALRGLVDDFAEHRPIDVRFDAPPSLPSIANDAEVALFRALQEALSNVARHANARVVTVVLSADTAGVTLRVIDDGRGLIAGATHEPDRERAGSGLAGMRERMVLLGGRVSVSNAPAGGVEVCVTVPVDGVATTRQASPASTDRNGRFV